MGAVALVQEPGDSRELGVQGSFLALDDNGIEIILVQDIGQFTKGKEALRWCGMTVRVVYVNTEEVLEHGGVDAAAAVAASAVHIAAPEEEADFLEFGGIGDVVDIGRGIIHPGRHPVV